MVFASAAMVPPIRIAVGGYRDTNKVAKIAVSGSRADIVADNGVGDVALTPLIETPDDVPNPIVLPAIVAIPRSCRWSR